MPRITSGWLTQGRTSATRSQKTLPNGFGKNSPLSATAKLFRGRNGWTEGFFLGRALTRRHLSCRHPSLRQSSGLFLHDGRKFTDQKWRAIPQYEDIYIYNQLFPRTCARLRWLPTARVNGSPLPQHSSVRVMRTPRLGKARRPLPTPQGSLQCGSQAQHVDLIALRDLPAAKHGEQHK